MSAKDSDAELFQRFLDRYWQWMETGQGLPVPPFRLRPGQTVDTRTFYDVLSRDIEQHLSFLAGQRYRPNPRAKTGTLQADVRAVLAIAKRSRPRNSK